MQGPNMNFHLCNPPYATHFYTTAAPAAGTVSVLVRCCCSRSCCTRRFSSNTSLDCITLARPFMSTTRASSVSFGSRLYGRAGARSFGAVRCRFLGFVLLACAALLSIHPSVDTLATSGTARSNEACIAHVKRMILCSNRNCVFVFCSIIDTIATNTRHVHAVFK
jgi:hypothetical protein